MIVFVTQRRRFWRLEGSEAVEPVAAEHAGEGGLGDGEDHADLGVGTTLAAQLQELGFEGSRSLEGLAKRSRRTIGQALREALLFGASEPATNGLFADAESGGGITQRAAQFGVKKSHLGSRQRGQSGISVHVVRGERRWVESVSTTSLPCPFRADNVLKHDT